MHFKRLFAGLGALLVLSVGLAFPAFAAPPANISYTVGICDPNFPSHCLAPSGGALAPGAVATTDRSGSITSGGTAQNAIAANTLRKGWCIQNTDPSEVMYVRAGGTASATTGTKLSAGTQACSGPTLVDRGAISVFAATTAHPWAGFEVQ